MAVRSVDPALANTILQQDDLTNLNVAAGQCVNKTIRQNITFGDQGLPFGINLGSGKKNSAAAVSVNFMITTVAFLLVSTLCL